MFSNQSQELRISEWSDRLRGFLGAYLFPLLLVVATFAEINLIGLFYNDVPLRLSIGDLGIAFLAGLVMILRRREFLARIKNNRVVFIVAVAFISIALVSGLFSGEYWLVSVKCCLRVYLLLLLLVSFSYDTYLARGTLICLFAYLIVINLLGVLEYFFPERLQEVLLLFRTQQNLYQFQYARSGSVFAHPNGYGIFNALILVTILSIQFGYRKFIPRPLFLLVSFACILGILFSGSRNAILVVLAGAGLLSALSIMHRRYLATVHVLLFTTVFAGIMLGGVFLNIAGLGRMMNHSPMLVSISHRMHSGSGEGTPLGMNDENVLNKRDLIWKEGIRQFKAHPLLGIGTNQFKYRNSMSFDGRAHVLDAHTFFGEILVGNGLIGMGLFIVLFACWIWGIKAYWQLPMVIALLAANMFSCFFMNHFIGLIGMAWLFMLSTRAPDELFIEPGDIIRTNTQAL